MNIIFEKIGESIMKSKKIKTIISTLCAAAALSTVLSLPVNAASKFDPNYYAVLYPDVVALLGADPQVLFNHYIAFGMQEGRLPYEGAAPGEAVDGILEIQTEVTAESENIQELVPIDQLANLSSLKKKTTDEEFIQAYNAALAIVAPYVHASREEQLYGIATALRQRFDSGMMYSMTADHYNDPYGYFVLGSASCAGCTRATGLCLNIIGIPYEHVNENQYSHQWCRVNVDGVYWICDAYGLYCGPEPAPYMHPYLQ